MLNKIKRENGITIITLVITVVLLVLITSTLAINSYNSMQLSHLKNLENDIKVLSDRIAAYYVKTGELPVNNTIYLKSELENRFELISENDGENYYEIDLSKIDNATLNYNSDTYIVNEESHNIYHLEGITYNGEVYHTVGKDNEILSVNNLAN